MSFLAPISRKYVASLIVFFATSASAVSAPTYFLDDPVASRAAFQAAALDLQLQSFEAFATGSTVAFPGLTVTSNSDLFPITTLVLSRAVSDGTQAMGVFEQDVAAVTFSFDSPIGAFGIDVNDLNFIDLSFEDDLGNVLTGALLGDSGGPAGGSGFRNRQFFGVVNTQSFRTVTFRATASTSSGIMTFDRLEFGPTTIPEPATTTITLLGIATLALLRLRR